MTVSMSIRKPVVAGQFYPKDAEELEAAIKGSFVSMFGPGSLPGKRGSKKIFGAVVPHAGYFFSGAGAAWVYKEIGEVEFPDTYVILGVNHSGSWTCTSDQDWETPFGVVKCDKEFVKKLYDEDLMIKNEQHNSEHSIEVQLPFLQFVSKDKADKMRIVPIMIADEQHEKWANKISKVADELGRKIVVICSSDFTHYGHNYGYVPFEGDVKKNMEKLDSEAIELILKRDTYRFFEFMEKTGATICGRYGISVLMALMEGKKGKLLKYYTSGDVLGDYSNAVGYAAIVFR